MKDSDNDWWVGVGSRKGTQWLGYYPGKLFRMLKYKATGVAWGGEIAMLQGNLDPPPHMRSGHFPNEGYGGAAYMRKVSMVDASNNLQDAPRDLQQVIDNSACCSLLLDCPEVSRDPRTGEDGTWNGVGSDKVDIFTVCL
ncbi:hypothetical protein ACLOJK_029595 [Asimina triloba]